MELEIQPCIKSGYCCTSAPCLYGQWNDTNTHCRFLSTPNDIGQQECEKAQWIKENVPDWQFYPAFGAGCSSTIGNTFRTKIIRAIIARKERGEDISKYISHITTKI